MLVRQRVHQPRVQKVKFGHIELGPVAAKLGDIEFGCKGGEIGPKIDRIGGPKLGEQRQDRHGFDPLFAQLFNR